MASDTPPIRDDEYLMVASDAMMAGTLALLTGHAQCTCERQRGLMARKIRSNLDQLAQQPGLAPAFRLVVQRLHGHWSDIVQRAEGAQSLRIDLPETRLWHAAPDSVH
jgi:hypothetical protein